MRNFDAVVVLGGGIGREGQLADQVPAQVKKGLQHVRASHAGHLILSGGWSHRIDFTPPRTEAAAMAECAFRLAADPDTVLLENKSTGTISQALHTKVDIMLPHNWDSALVIGAAGHSRSRLEFIFRQVWGPDLDFEVQTLWHRQAPKIRAREYLACLATRTLLLGTSPGDHERVAKLVNAQNANSRRRRPNNKLP